MTHRIAYIVSPHGFGHASRSAAVLNALFGLRPEVVPQIFTTVPLWFWQDSLDGPFDLHETPTDVGMVQESPIEEDPAATLRALESFRPFENAARPLANALARLECRMAICDISPLGLAAANLAGIPSVLVESFTWDWIYAAYFEAEPGLRAVATEMAELFDGAGLRIQTEPVSRPVAGARTVHPVSRRGRAGAPEVREALGLDDSPIVLVTMGGFSWALGSLDGLQSRPELSFVAFTGTHELERHGNVLLLPDRSPVFLPDLIAAADVVVGKLGYSTVAEAWAAGTRYAYMPRARFPEGPSLAAFVGEHLPSVELDRRAFLAGDWLDSVVEVLQRPRPQRQVENGADTIAGILAERLAWNRPNDGLDVV